MCTRGFRVRSIVAGAPRKSAGAYGAELGGLLPRNARGTANKKPYTMSAKEVPPTAAGRATRTSCSGARRRLPWVLDRAGSPLCRERIVHDTRAAKAELKRPCPGGACGAWRT